jgi:signal transduction histidine kinase
MLRQSRAILPDTQRALTVFSLEQEYHLADDVEARRVALKGLDYARQIGFLRGEYMILSDLCRIAISNENLLEAERWAQELQRRTDAAPPKLHRFRAVALQTRATLANSQGEPARSNLLMRQALVLLQALPRPWPYLEMLSYYGLSSEYTDQATNRAGAPDSLVQQALYYTRRFAGLARSQGRPDLLAQAYKSLAQLADVRPLTPSDSVAYYFAQSRALDRQTGLQDYEQITELAWAQSELAHHRYAAATEHTQAALAIALRLKDIRNQLRAHNLLAEIAAGQGQNLDAYHHLQTARYLNDSLVQLNNQEALQKLQVRFETERKESRIRELTQRQQVQQVEAAQQRQRIWALAAVLATVLIGLGVAAILAIRLRRSRTQLAIQNELLASQRDELAQARATQDRLYALVAHDLRSPVVAFTGLADLLARYVSKGDTERLAGLGGRIRQAAQSLSALLDNLLNWALSQRGELVAQPRPLDTAELLAESAALYESAALAANVELRVEAENGLQVQADEQMTRTILRNLIGNALKATPAGGRVVLRTERGHHETVVLRVADAGPGLSAEALDQLNAAPRTMRVAGRGTGAGLGLLLSRAFAEAQGGSLVIGAATGGGTEAAVHLPLAP